MSLALLVVFFFFNDTATTEIYTLSLHDALPICMKPTSATEPNHRILVIDDNRAIHDDMRKVLIGDSATHADLEPDEELLFGATPVAATRFEIDSAYQGQEGLALLAASIAEGRPYAMAFVD